MKDELVVEEQLKECNKCGEVKPLSEFYISSDGYYRWTCTKCRYEKAKKQKKENPERWKEIKRKADKKYSLENPEKIRAKKILERAVAKGEVYKPPYCSYCGKSCSPQGHHEDYSRPKEVAWLCAVCHNDYHHGRIRTDELTITKPRTVDWLD